MKAKKRNYEYTDQELAEIARVHLDFKSPAFQFYPNDFIGSNRVMMLEDYGVGAYLYLLLAAWGEKDCGLPTDRRKMLKLSRLSEEKFTTIYDELILFFFEYKGRFYNRRLLEERLKQIKKRIQSLIAINIRHGKIEKGNTDALTEKLLTYGIPKELWSDIAVNETEDEIENEKDLKEEGDEAKVAAIQKPLEPEEERVSEYGGPPLLEVVEFFGQHNRRNEEAVIFWNEYEGKCWIIKSDTGPPRNIKKTRQWQLKAEQWIKKSRLTEIEKAENETKRAKEGQTKSAGYGGNSKLDHEKGSVSSERLDGLAAKARGDSPIY